MRLVEEPCGGAEPEPYQPAATSNAINRSAFLLDCDSTVSIPAQEEEGL